jgi:hypothetical protein
MQTRNCFGFQACHAGNRAFEPRLPVEGTHRFQRRPAVKNRNRLRRNIRAQAQ